ncbi:hypothetical protein, partial [Phocaeicola dorei]|uniref:hypothetical protein n=1 Tax=Phocaeicola dorei TaxID=357276 RepID=UPI000FEF1220
DKDTSCYTNTYRMGIHTTLTRCIGTHFFSLFPAFFTTEYGERSRGRAGKTARACERRIFPDPDLRNP